MKNPITRIKLFTSGYKQALEFEVNKFLLENAIDFIDLKFTSDDHDYSICIIYKEENYGN